MAIALKNVLDSGTYSFFHGSVAKYSSLLDFAKTAIPGRFLSPFKKNIFLTLLGFADLNAIGVESKNVK